jgi:hypothetical protein
MKTTEEIEKIAEKLYPISPNPNQMIEGFERVAYKKGYIQCQEDNDWTKNCECESSIGQTWCCNQCGLPYDTRKSDKKYTEEDMLKAFEKGALYGSTKNGNTHYFDEIIKSLKKQD